MTAIETWAEVLLRSEGATRDQLAEVASAIGRVAAPDLTPVLERLLAEELARWRKARAERAYSPTARQEAYRAYALQYRRAFASIGGDQVAARMMTYLADADFSVDAAAALKTLWDRQHEPTKGKGFALGPDFSQVTQRIEREERRGTAMASPFSEAIIATIDRTIDAGLAERDVPKTFELAEIAFGMPYGERPDLVERLLRLPASLYHRRAFLTVLVQAGEVIRYSYVADVIGSLCEEAKTSKPWLLDQDQTGLSESLALVPFSDAPEKCLEIIKILEPRHRHPWNLQSLVAALGVAPTPQAEQYLEALARECPALFNEHGWLNAVSRRGTFAGVHVLLDLIVEGVVDYNGSDGWWLSKTLAAQMRLHAEVRTTFYGRYSCLDAGPGKRLIEQAIAEAADAPGVLLLVRGYAQENRTFDGMLHTAVQRAALGEWPALGWSGATEVFGVPVPELRRELFQLVDGDRAESSVAEACLTAIDELRDEYGTVESEPRHPDVATGRPWPRLGIAR